MEQKSVRVFSTGTFSHIDGELLEQIRGPFKKGLVFANDRFKDEVEIMYGRKVRPAKMGRPNKSLI